MEAELEGHEKKGSRRSLRRSWYTDACMYDMQGHGSFVVCPASSIGKTFSPDTCVSGEAVQHGASSVSIHQWQM